MEDIDIEDLDFEVYKREIYQERDNKSNPRNKNSIYIDALKRFKEKINAFVQEYHNKNKSYEDNETKEKKVY